LPTPRGKKAEKEETPTNKVKTMVEGSAAHPVKALTYKDPFQQVYKKYLFTMDGKYLLGGMMIGDTKDYVKLVPMVKNKQALEVPPSELILGASKGDDDGDDLYADSCDILITPTDDSAAPMMYRSARAIMSQKVILSR